MPDNDGHAIEDAYRVERGQDMQLAPDMGVRDEVIVQIEAQVWGFARDQSLYP